MAQIKNSTVDSSKFFNLNGLDYEKGDWGFVYLNEEVNSVGVINDRLLQIGIRSKALVPVTIQEPIHYFEYTDGTGAPYESLDSLVEDLILLLSSSLPLPKTISNLKGWWDASDLSSITKDGSERVSSVLDLSGKGRDFLQGTETNQPLYESSTTSIHSDSGDRFMASGAINDWNFLIDGTGGHIFLVMKQDQTSTVNGLYTFLGFDFDAGNRLFIRSRKEVTLDDALNYIHISGDAALSANVTLDNFYRQDQFGLLKISNSIGSSPNMSFDFSDFAGDSQNYAATPLSGTSAPLEFGASEVEFEWQELIIYDRVLTSEEESTVNDYLVNKWNL